MLRNETHLRAHGGAKLEWCTPLPIYGHKAQRPIFARHLRKETDYGP
jgi:hypothetical protein